MSAKDNVVYLTSSSLVQSDSSIPEESILGYVKLMMMNESTLQTLLSEEARQELEQVRRYMVACNMDIELMKQGLSHLITIIRRDESYEYGDYSDFIQKASKNVTSLDIVKKALESARIPIKETFSKGKTLSDVFSYANELKDRIVVTPKEENLDEDEDEEADEEENENMGQTANDADEEAKEDSSVSEKTSSKKSNNRKLPKPPKGDYMALSEYYRQLSCALLDEIKGQDDAVSKFVEGCFRGQLIHDKPNRKSPLAHFLFFGPPGTGKTYLAETTAELMDIPFFKLDMSTLDEKTWNMFLLFVKKNPECLILVDEIEKHEQAPKLFLQILGSGELSGVDFTKSMIIFTSNLGSMLYENRRDNLTTLPVKVILDAIGGEEGLPPEFCSRIATGNVIAFNHLKLHHLVDMTDAQYRDFTTDMNDEYSMKVSYEKELPMFFLYHIGDEVDARMVSGQSGNFLKSELYELGRQLVGMKTSLEQPINSAHIGIDWKGIDGDIRKLFVNEGKTEILFFADPQYKALLSLDESHYTLHWASDYKEAMQLQQLDLSAVFIDPLYKPVTDNSNIMSIADYDTEGVKLFHSIVESDSDLAIYVMDVNKAMAAVDKRTFIQEGAYDIPSLDTSLPAGFCRQFDELMSELYMERESLNFFSQGWVIGFKTRQDVSMGNGHVEITYYDICKQKAVDVASQSVILNETERPKVRFSDVIGAESAKADLKFYSDFLKNPKAFLSKGNKAPRGVLLYGPPGTGKTLLARAMAGESDVTYIATNAAAFKNKYVGESEANVRRLFARARKYAPSIVFIDEIDAIGTQRTGDSSNRHTEELLNALLTEMDGFDSMQNVKRPVFVLAATNFGARDGERTVKLDDALLRRFDEPIYVELPKKEDRIKFLQLKLSKIAKHAVTEGVVQNLAERTPGTSLAILENVFGKAMTKATRKDEPLCDQDLLDALDEYEFGDKKERSKEYYQRVAVHEVGHAYVSYHAGAEPAHVTIESRGDHGGYMMPGQTEEKVCYSYDEIKDRIRVSLAGRAAEEVFYGAEIANNTGASSDLNKATNLAFDILSTYGMGSSGLAVISRQEIMQSSLAGEYLAKVNELLNSEMMKAKEEILKGKNTVQTIANALVEKNQLTGAEFKQLMCDCGEGDQSKKSLLG